MITNGTKVYETLFQKPISQEEEERRKRAASVATGIGHLGNVLSSFSNLAFAGEAPSQKLPTVADPKLQSYSDRLEAIRQRYGAGYLPQGKTTRIIIKGHCSFIDRIRREKPKMIWQKPRSRKVPLNSQ